MRAAPMGSYVCILVPQLVELFGDGLGVVVLLEVVPLGVDTEVSLFLNGNGIQCPIPNVSLPVSC